MRLKKFYYNMTYCVFAINLLYLFGLEVADSTTTPATLGTGHHGLFTASHQEDNCDIGL